MTLFEAITHNWKKGEKVWAVMFKTITLPGVKYDSLYSMPVGVEEITVTHVDKNIIDNVKKVEITFDVDNEYVEYICRNLTASCNMAILEKAKQFNGTMNCETKFFDRQSALEKLSEISQNAIRDLNHTDRELGIYISALENELREVHEKSDKLHELIASAEAQIVPAS